MNIRKKDHNVPILLMTAYDDIASEHSILEDLHIVKGESIAVKISPLYLYMSLHGMIINKISINILKFYL